MKKELLIKIGFDTDTESISDIVKLVLDITATSNDRGMYVISAMIDDKVVFDNRGFVGCLRDKDWEE